MQKKIFIFFICVIIFKFIYIPIKYENVNENKKYILMIESKNKEKDNYVSYVVRLGKKHSSGYSFKDKFILNIYTNSFNKKIFQKEDITKFRYGDVLTVDGKITIPEYMNNPGEFNYKRYIYSNNIYGIINTYAEVERSNYSLNIFQKIICKLYEYKEYMSQKLDNEIDTKYSNVIKGIIYGEKLGIEEDIKENFQNLGVSHILSVSGAHISSLIMTLNFLLFKIKNKKVKGILNILLTSIYVIISGMSISSIRAYIMVVCNTLCSIQEKRQSRIKSIITAFLLILLNTPYAIFNLGFQLSFLATLGIILYLPLFKKWIHNKTKNINSKVVKKLVKYLLNSIVLTISVQIMILPIEISSLNHISLLIIFSNVIFGIFTVPIQIVGSIYMLFSYIPYLDKCLIILLNVITKTLIYVSEILNKVSFNISTMSYPAIFHLVYYLILIVIFGYIKLNGMVKSYTEKLKRRWRKIKFCSILTVVIYILSIGIYTVYNIYYSSFIYFFNVGQGEMSYIKHKDKSIIIDIGSVSNTLAGYTISNYFKSQNIKYVDMVILTHMHKDHVNGLSKLLEICKIGKVIYSKPESESDIYNEFLDICKKHNLNICEGIKGSKYLVGEIKVEILSPGKNKIQDKDYINTNSIICKVSVNEKNILYMADATYATEEYLLKNTENLKDIYILKVSHHGSKNGSKDEFIQCVNPKFAVISAKKKYYNHPNELTIETLKKYNIHILITENLGAIKFNMYNLW